MTNNIRNIEFLNGWEGKEAIRIKVYFIDPIDGTTSAILEKDLAEKLLIERLSNGYNLSLKPAQKIYRIVLDAINQK